MGGLYSHTLSLRLVVSSNDPMLRLFQFSLKSNHCLMHCNDHTRLVAIDHGSPMYSATWTSNVLCATLTDLTAFARWRFQSFSHSNGALLEEMIPFD